MGSSGSLTHPVMPARPSEAPMTLRNPRREALSSHSEAPLGNSRWRASWKAGLPASSSSERQYSGPVFSALSCAVAASILSRTVPRSSFLVGQMSSSLTNCDLLSVVICLLCRPQALVELRSTDSRWRLSPHNTSDFLKPKQLSVTGAATCYIADADLAVGRFYPSSANPIFGDQVCAERILIGKSAAIHVDGVDRRGLLVAHVKNLI